MRQRTDDPDPELRRLAIHVLGFIDSCGTAGLSFGLQAREERGDGRSFDAGIFK